MTEISDTERGKPTNTTEPPAHVAVGNCKGCGHRIQALRMTILGRDATPNVNPETCIYCPKEPTNV